MKKERSSNIELLRIIAMFAIIIYHIFRHCIRTQLIDSNSIELLANGYFSYPIFYNKLLILQAISPIGQIANNIFIIISGYFLVSKKKVNIENTSKKLIYQLLYSIVLLVIGSFIVYELIGNSNYISLITFNSMNSRSWFVGYYYLIFLTGYLFLNKYLNKLSKDKYKILLLILFCVIQFSWIKTLSNGITSVLSAYITGIFLYSLGGYISKYKPFENIKGWSLILIIFILYGFVLLSFYNKTSLNIQDYIISGSTKPFVQSIILFKNENFVTIVIATIIFELFSRIKMKTNKVINYISSSTLLVYILHDNKFVYSLWNINDWITLLYKHTGMFILKYLLYALITFIICFILYVIYDGIVKLFPRIKKVFVK